MTRPSDSGWRQGCLDLYGHACPACRDGVPGGSPAPSRIEVDHLHPRSQGGLSVVGNGLPLCPGHHRAKTESRLVLRFEWLSWLHLDYLARAGWVAWDADGNPYGPGERHFQAIDPLPGAPAGHLPALVYRVAP